MHHTTWTPEKDAKLRELKAKGLCYKEIAQQLGLSVAAVKCHWLYLHLSPAGKRNYLDKHNASRRDRHTAPKAHYVATPEIVPPEVWAERNARLAAPKTITGWLMGDPDPTRSALAQKQGVPA